MHEKLTEVIQILKSSRDVSLGTLDGGLPFVSATGFIYLEATSASALGDIYILLSDLARHAKNLKKDAHASLLITEPKYDLPIHERKRVTLKAFMGVISDEKEHNRLKLKYMDAFPRSEIFFSLADFRFYAAKIEEVHWIGGFGQAATWNFQTQ